MRTIRDAGGIGWKVETISGGLTSGYLSSKAHRSILQFTCLDRRLPRHYAPYPVGQARILAELSDAELLGVLRGARPH